MRTTTSTPPRAADIDARTAECLEQKCDSVIALGGIDAFAHTFESHASKNATLYSKMVALESMRLFAENIVACVEDGKNLEARTSMAFKQLGRCLTGCHPRSLPGADHSMNLAQRPA